MEGSSPLAAMQPPSMRFGDWGSCMEGPTSYSQLAAANRMGHDIFNFKRSPSDYFNLKPLRGSSPAASLAADISQNFHIDQSPQLPTPRRSLFSSNLFATLDGRDIATTPPLPSSSPAPGNDSMMDISPIPQKPLNFTYQTELQSPTPDGTPTREDTNMLSSPDPLVASPLEHARPSFLDRKRSNHLRPSLARKGYSTNMVQFSSEVDSKIPPFKYRTSNGLGTSTSSMSLSEAFMASPQHDKSLVRNHSGHLYGGPRLKPAFGATSNPRGSPSNGHIRKPSAPVARPRKHVRRALSMFESPGDMIKNEEVRSSAGELQAIMDVEDQHVPQLPHYLLEDQSDNLPRITRDTLINALDGKYDSFYKQRIIIDCRFEYEYKGGHIDGAENFNDKEDLESRLFDNPPTCDTLLILHCEYSAHRAPHMARFVRQADRAKNKDIYPQLTYPEICYPQNYVEMEDAAHASACERGLSKVKQQRSKLTRAQTFAFGEQSPNIEESPTTAVARHNHHNHNTPSLTAMGFTTENFFDIRQCSKRSTSY
ncbi:MAG: cell division cycle- protein [Cirrosporium novae-zelandiae]|nr:MAG: cell division cycle- protein [Cirrosporium novae-zelandiae]